MYKRPPSKNAFQYKEPKAKMPRLDVSLSGAGSSASSQNKDQKPTSSTLQLQRPSTPKAVTNYDKPTTSSAAYANRNEQYPSTSTAAYNGYTARPYPDRVRSPSSAYTLRPNEAHHQLQTNNVPPPKNKDYDENLWGDADDEFILIASQMVDNMDMDAINQQIIVQSMNMSQPNTVETKMPNEAQNILKNFLYSTEDDDRLFSEINNFDNFGNPEVNGVLNSTVIPKTQQQNGNERPTSPTVFKVPNAPCTIQSSTQIDMNFSFRPESHPQSTQFSQRIEIPRPMEPTATQAGTQNLKVKFLTQKQSDLQKEIEHLHCENQRLTELCQTKDGESSLLRSENERLKNQFDNIRREKSAEISKLRNDLSLKMSELEKTILDLRSQLQFKEISSMHNRKSISTQPPPTVVRPEAVSNDWERFKLPNKTWLPVPASRPVDPRMYISSQLCDLYWVSINDKKQWEYLNGLQVILADLVSNKDSNHNCLSKMFEEVFKLAWSGVTEMYASSMRNSIDSKKNDISYTYAEICEWKEYSIVAENKLFDREEIFLSRRILVCVATICEQFPQFSTMLFRRSYENGEESENFLELLSSTIRNLSYCKDVANVQGFIESSCLLLAVLAENYDVDISTSIPIFSGTLHNILLCRPGIGSLERISKFLELMSYRSKTIDFLDALCVNRNTYDITEPQGYIRYTADSCTLQMYALLIRLHILPHESMKVSIKQLTAVTQSTLLFMRYSMLVLPKWLAKRSNCLCRARVFGAIVSLLYVFLLHWIEHPNEIDPQSISVISKFGIEFFYENLVKNYDDELLNSGGTIIKNRIRMIVEWLNSYDFKFKSPHQHALESVCLQRLGPMVEYLRYNKKIAGKYSAEAAVVYRDVVDSFFDECEL